MESGFGFEALRAVRRRILEDDGSFVDSALFGLLSSEWSTATSGS